MNPVLLVALAVVLQNPPRTPAAHISGVVVEDGSNVPVARAKVTIVQADKPLLADGTPPEAFTDREGRFTFREVAPGRYRVEAEHETFAPQLDESAFPVIDVEAGQDVTNVTIVLSHGGVIAGSVMGLAGQPVARAHAFALLKRLDIAGVGDPPDPDGTPTMLPVGNGQTNARGEFRIDKLPAGDYLVVAEASGERAPSGQAIGITYYASTTQQSAARVVTVLSGQTVKNITITLVAAPMFHVSGTVVDADGSPVPNAYVSLMPDMRADGFALIATGAHASAQTDGDGAFVFGDIPRGSYIVSAGGAGGDNGIGALAGTVLIDSTGTLTAKTNGKTLPLAPGTAAVKVRDADVADVKVVATKPR